MSGWHGGADRTRCRRPADRLIVAVFIAEILAKIVVYRRGFARDPWNVFDFVVISLSILPATDSFSVLRAFRVLRILRLVAVVPSMRQVVRGLLNAIPGMATTAGLLLLSFYLFSVIATKLFGDTFPSGSARSAPRCTPCSRS
jgi:voltage-gated sodium channel